jgi:hypothetical protein
MEKKVANRDLLSVTRLTLFSCADLERGVLPRRQNAPEPSLAEGADEPGVKRRQVLSAFPLRSQTSQHTGLAAYIRLRQGRGPWHGLTALGGSETRPPLLQQRSLGFIGSTA